MGKKSRRKGRQGESICKRLLQDHDWEIIADCTAGCSTEDFIVKHPHGTLYSVEVKNNKIIDVDRFRKQARENAKAKNMPYLLMCKWFGTKMWLVEMQCPGEKKPHIMKWWEK